MQTNPQKFCEHIRFVTSFIIGGVDQRILSLLTCPFCPQRPPEEKKDWLKEILLRVLLEDDDFSYSEKVDFMANLVREHIKKNGPKSDVPFFKNPSVWGKQNEWESFLGISERKAEQ